MGKYSKSGLTLLLFIIFAPLGTFADEVRDITFPVSGEFRFRDDFLEPRGADGARQHIGIDIVSPKMTPLVSAVDGVISYIATTEPSWGYSITIRDAEGYTYRYLHINNDTPGTDDGKGGAANAYAPGLSRGQSVSRGQHIGWVGDSGNAESTVSHLHFEMRDPTRSVFNPYESLRKASGYSTSGTASTSVDYVPDSAPLEEEFIMYYRNYFEGTVHSDVVVIHASLKSLGYYSGPEADMYSATTREAVRKFQSDHGLQPTGIADALTMRALRDTTKVTTTITPSSSSLVIGSSGTAVMDLQSQLKELGYFGVEPTGYFGPITESAVIAFQRASGVDPIGIVGPKTRAALAAASSETGVPASAPIASSYVFSSNLSRGSRGEAVSALQKKLKELGHFGDEPTGYFGPLTEAAVTLFQSTHGIEAVGIVGPKTREKLNSL